MYLVSKEFTFDAAHYLPLYHGKCESLHGHTYKLLVSVHCPELQNGIGFDFVELNRIVKSEIIALWDHQLINDYLENPSAEHMCEYIWQRLSQEEFLGDKLYEVKLWETPTSCVVFRGKNGFVL